MRFLNLLLVTLFVLLGETSVINIRKYSNYEVKMTETEVASDGEEIIHDTDEAPLNSDVNVEFVSRTEETVTLSFKNIPTETDFSPTIDSFAQTDTNFALISDQTIILFKINPILWQNLADASYLTFNEDNSKLDAQVVLQSAYTDEFINFTTGNNESIKRYTYDITSDTELTNVHFIFGILNISEESTIVLDSDEKDMFSTFTTNEVITIPTYDDFINPPDPPVVPPENNDSDKNVIIWILIAIFTILFLLILIYTSTKRKKS